MKKLLFLIPIFLYANVWMLPFSISEHFQDKTGCEDKGTYKKCYEKFNKNHKPIGLVYDFNKNYSIIVMQYKNSIDNKSNSMAISKNYPINEYLAFSISTGVVDGYPEQNIYHPIIFPSMTLKYKRVALDIAGTHEVIFASLRFKIW